MTPVDQDLSPLTVGASWITSEQWRADPTGGLPVLGTTLRADTPPASAVLRVCGLGVFVASMNGRLVSDDVLEPGYTDYAKRAEYCTYDVTTLVEVGDNVLHIELGPGMYRSQRHDDRWTKILTDYGDLAACASLTLGYPGGQEVIFLSGTDWGATLGQTRSSNWTGGEDFDARVQLDTSASGVRAWPRAVVARTPTELALTPKTTPALRVREVIEPKSITPVAPRTHVVDLGVNVAGWVELDLPPQSEVTLRPAELLKGDGDIDPTTEGWGPVYHTVRTGDRPLTWHPRFCYNGLRYLEVAGLEEPLRPEEVRGLVIAAGARATGEFSCSDQMLNQIHRLVHRAVTSNMYSVFTDCPHREKLAFLEELHLVYPILQWNYDVQALLTNTMLLTREAQGPDGHLPLYVPEWDPFPDPWRGDVNWGGAIIHVPWQLHRSYDDISVLRDNYEAMTRYAEHILLARVDGLVRYGLGDWDGREARAVPLVTTSALARMLCVLSQVAETLGLDSDAARWRKVADDVVERVRDEFWTDDLSVGADTLGETVIALQCGVVPPEHVSLVVNRLEERIARQRFVVDVGEVGMAALVEVLAAHDRHETLYRVACQEELPGYGYMIRHGATSLTETWDGPTFGISQNHFMNGAIDAWFYSHVAGLQQTPTSCGFRDLVVRPRPCGDLRSATASYRTKRGTFSSAWTIEEETFRLEVEVPPGSQCAVETPDGRRRCVGSGKHAFESALR
ncbi:family 78 glycoside hydrolase catalytic domain [Jiangella asiatica]|uniref:family 78 glycoside hydrolase catalytic domain n=1 Tax=Jiangella asiatica TaxID=2530372 RepID=UPI0013A5E490|nr:family 78 glycoside hydrolase catalytic domain [Jiangella asiatica]